MPPEIVVTIRTQSAASVAVNVRLIPPTTEPDGPGVQVTQLRQDDAERPRPVFPRLARVA